MPAEGLLAGLALVAAAPALLDRVLSATGGMAAAGSAYTLSASAGRTGSGRNAADPGAGGRTASRTEARRRRRIRRRAVGGAVVAACVAGGGGLWYLDKDPGARTEEPTAARTVGAPRAELSEVNPVETSASPTPSKSPSPSPKPTKKASPSISPTPTKKASPTPRPSPTPTRTPSSRPQSQPVATDTVGQVVALVNKERSAAGCGPLAEDGLLNKAAQAHSEDMAARGFFDHTNPDGADPGQRITAAGYRWSTYGENIAMGQQTPEAVIESWMNSPGHRANILNCSFKDIGVGIHNGSGGPWWTQNFGAKQ